jgi:hypothetical protein
MVVDALVNAYVLGNIAMFVVLLCSKTNVVGKPGSWSAIVVGVLSISYSAAAVAWALQVPAIAAALESVGQAPVGHATHAAQAIALWQFVFPAVFLSVGCNLVSSWLSEK